MPYPASYPNYVFSIFAFIGFLMCAIPLPWHLEAWNTGTCLYMIWTGLGCLNLFINSIIWNRNAINWAPVWCDISSKLIIGLNVAVPAASLCINRRLYHIASVRTVTTTKAEKRRAVMVDLSIGVGLPVLAMILHYIPQGHRFDIMEDIGCWPETYSSWVAFVLVYTWPVAIGLVSGTYAIFSILAFNKSRAQFNELLASHGNLTANRYIRLMCLGGVEVIFTVPLGLYSLIVNATVREIRPWISFANTHWRFARVDLIPSILWRSTTYSEFTFEFTRWATVFCAFVFFAFFGFADEARKNYRCAFQSVAKRVGISTGSFGVTDSIGIFKSTGSKSTGTGSTGKIRPVHPVHVHKEMLRRQDSLDSFGAMSLNIADVGGLLGEKKEEPVFSPITTYGGTLADYSDSPYSGAPSSRVSCNSCVSIPEPARTRPGSLSDIEISSMRAPSITNEPPSYLSSPEVTVTPPPKSNTADIV